MGPKSQNRGGRRRKISDSSGIPSKAASMDVSMDSIDSGNSMDVCYTQQSGILSLPYEIIRHIFSYMTEKDIFWGLGMTCKILMAYSLDVLKTIEIPRSSNPKETLRLLLEILQRTDVAAWIRHVVMLGDFSKILLDQSLQELKGIIQKLHNACLIFLYCVL